MTDHPRLPRRHFLIGSAAGAAGVMLLENGMPRPAFAQGERPLPDYVDWKERDALIVHWDNTIETRRDAFGPASIMPSDRLYIRNNLPPPSEERTDAGDNWEVRLEGVRTPGSMTVGELKRLGLTTVAAVLQCSGNGRAFFDHDASGTQWTVGAAGNVLWSGVPLTAVAEAFGGVAANRRYITGTGGEDLPQGVDPLTVIVERSVPIEALEHAILAFDMNGEPISRAHGGPVRLVLPGYYGVNNVKYLTRLAFTENESQASIQRTGYRIRPVGVRGAADQPSMWRMDVKSWITHPLQESRSGPVLIHGVAFGGYNALRGVSVSTDGGSNWHEAELIGPDMGRFAWRGFVLKAPLDSGTHLLASRATDSNGTMQPEQVEPNERGYGHNGWRDHAVELTVS